MILEFDFVGAGIVAGLDNLGEIDMESLAGNFNVAYRSLNPEKDFLFTPAILVLENGRYVMSFDISDQYGKICTSDDKGETWQLKAEDMFAHASLFKDGGRIYLLGCRALDEDLIIMYSDDNGESWSEESFLTHGEAWEHCATDVWYKDGYVYVPMEASFLKEGEAFRSGWKPNIYAPVILRGKLGTDLTNPSNWLFSDKVRFRDVIGEEEIEGIGVPFYPTIDTAVEGRNLLVRLKCIGTNMIWRKIGLPWDFVIIWLAGLKQMWYR